MKEKDNKNLVGAQTSATFHNPSAAEILVCNNFVVDANTLL